MFGYSKEYNKYLKTRKCPLCNKFIIFGIQYLKSDGTPISIFDISESLDRSLVFKCPKCFQKFNVYAISQTISPKNPSLKIIEFHISEESLGEEQRLIDNSKSSINMTRSLKISKEWSQSCTLEYEKACTTGKEFNIGTDMAASIKISAEKAIKKKYSISEETHRTYTEEVVLNIPKNTKVRVFFNWKLIWQHGVIKLSDINEEIKIPFKAIVGVSFDQRQVDEK